jgi:PBSX family phage terminase large subunit
MPKQFYSPKQAEILLQADARWNLMSGAVRSGKTHITFDLMPVRVAEQGAGDFLLIGKTERTLKRNVLNPMRKRFGQGNVSEVFGDGEIKLFGRHAYIVGANDERAVTKIQGMGIVYGYGDEVPTWPESFFQMLKSRLSEPGAKFDGTCNPEGPYHWLKEFIDNTANLKHWHFHIDDNPFLDADFVEALKNEYTGLWYKRYIEGLWVLAEGVIYDMWDEEKHVIDDCPDATHYYISIDYGTGNPTAIGLYGVSGNTGWKIKEYYYDHTKYGRQKTDAEYSQDLATFLGDIRPRQIIVDPSALSFKTQLKKDGFSNIKDADNSVIDGIRTQATMLQTGRYKVHRSCKETIREYSGYVWDSKAQSKGEDKPMKQNDHTKDEERYFLHTIFGKERKLKAGLNIY